MPRKCDHCGECAIEEDEQVCKACGVVVEDIIFGQEFTVYQKTSHPQRSAYSSVSNKVRFSNKAKPKIGIEYGLSALRNLCHVFGLPAQRELEVKNMLESVYPSKKYRVKEDVGVLAGCCLFLVQRRNNEAIPLNKICSQLQCTRKRFGFFLNFMKSWLKVTNSSFFDSVDEENESILSSFTKKDEYCDPDLPGGAESLISVVCKHAAEEEKSKLLKKTSELVKLAYSCWLYTGRSPNSVVVACAFLCWKSMHHRKGPTSFSKFCSIMKIREPVAKFRIPELKALLLQLGQKIPSRRNNYVNEGNLLLHLDRILENSETLRNDLLEDEYLEEKINCKEFHSFREPPKTIRRRAESCTVPSDSNVNDSDIEISDTEIDSYIIGSPRKRIIENLCEKGVSLPTSSS